MKKVIVSPSLILEVVWVQQNIAAGNRHRSMRLIQSHWEPCLECNSLLPDDPVEPAVELFFTTQHVKYACKGSHKRQRAGVEKKKSVLEQTCISFPWDEHKKKKREASSTQQPQSAGTIALETTQGHFVLLCQLSHSIQWDEGRKKLSSRAPTILNENFGMLRGTREWPQRKISMSGCEFFRNTTKPWS